MFIRRILAILACIFVILPASAVEQPNIVVIIADDIGYADLAFLPQAPSDVKKFGTPGFDRLAKTGTYFQNAYDRTADDGVFVMDCFGGSQCYEPNEEETEHDTFSYFWDQDSFDPISNEAMFYIWFQPEGGQKVKGFTYDWRMWSIPELKDILEEVGFKKINTYWEGTDEDGEGDGEFVRVEEGEDCESWVAYLACEK